MSGDMTEGAWRMSLGGEFVCFRAGNCGILVVNRCHLVAHGRLLCLSTNLCRLSCTACWTWSTYSTSLQYQHSGAVERGNTVQQWSFRCKTNALVIV